MATFSIQYQYFKIAPRHQAYHGIRYFRVSVSDFNVLQCLESPGSESRRGRSNSIGIYLISQTTFYSNYMPFGYAIQCDEREFYNSCWKVLGAFFPNQTQKFKKRKK